MKTYKIRAKAITKAFHYQGQYTMGCPKWAQKYIAAHRGTLKKDCWIIQKLDNGVYAFPNEAFEAIYEIIEEIEEKNDILNPEGEEDPTKFDPMVA